MPPQKIIVRSGTGDYYDSNYAGIMHHRGHDQLGVVDIDEDGNVVRRTTLPAADGDGIREHLNAAYRGTKVYVDRRPHDSLVPLADNDMCETLDFTRYRRAKSDEEHAAMRDLEHRTSALFGKQVDVDTYRGTLADEEQLRSAFQKRVCNGFIEYRGGLQNSRGITTDQTVIEPLNEKWQQRNERVDRAFRAVEGLVTEGRPVKEIDDVFMGCLDPQLDVQYGSCIRHACYDHHENIPLDTVKRYDMYRFGAGVGDRETNEVALYYRGTVFVEDDDDLLSRGADPVAPERGACGVPASQNDIECFRNYTPPR